MAQMGSGRGKIIEALKLMNETSNSTNGNASREDDRRSIASSSTSTPPVIMGRGRLINISPPQPSISNAPSMSSLVSVTDGRSFGRGRNLMGLDSSFPQSSLNCMGIQNMNLNRESRPMYKELEEIKRTPTKTKVDERRTPINTTVEKRRTPINTTVEERRTPISKKLDRAESPMNTKREVKNTSRNTELEEKPKVDTPVIKLGKSGHAVDISTNFLRLSLKSGHGAFEYHVTFTPDTDSRGFRIKMLREHLNNLGPDLTFDGQTLYLPKRLQSDKNVFRSKHPIDNTDVAIEVVFIKEKQLCEMVHLYNVLFKRIMDALDYTRIGRNSFDMRSSHSLPNYKLKLLPGYVTTVSVYEDGLMLNLDPSHKILRTQTVLAEIEIILNIHNNKEAVKQHLVGKSILTQYNGKLYAIDDIDFNLNPMSSFETKMGTTISYVEYYKNQHGIDIIDLKQPLLINRCCTRKGKLDTEKKVEEKLICLIPELCNMTGLSEDMRNNMNLMKQLSSVMKISPNQRYQLLNKYVENVNNSPKAVKLLANWGLTLNSEPVSVSARLLNNERIKFGGKVETQSAEWTREVVSNPVITAIDISHWVVLYTKKNEFNVKEFCSCIIRCGQSTGIKVLPPKMVLLPSDRTDTYVNSIRNEIHESLQLVVCVCPSSRDDRYNAIKKICCIDKPIASQVINGFTISNQAKLRSISHKILLQMNCKLGGALWTVPIPYSKLMVVGLDVYHSSAHSTAQSVCGFVASYNPNLTRWYSRVCFQKQGQETMENVKVFFLDALVLYKNENGYYPDRIVIYRDGVGDGQLKSCNIIEIPQFESCFSIIDEDYKPAFTFIVVQKRNNTRIFGGNSNHENPRPGTIIDNTITRRYLYDFYVVSHKVREGSLVPTHYIVLHDTSNSQPDHVQWLTFKMCHLYFNWPGTVRVPAPCQYAHKLAFLVGSNLKKEHHRLLETRLFFL